MSIDSTVTNKGLSLIKRIGLALAAAMALTVGISSTASAQQSGLVNVNVEDVDLGVIAQVQVPIGIAANVCNVGANVLAADIDQDGEAECTADAETVANNRAIQPFLGDLEL
jgi:hypothetical protein